VVLKNRYALNNTVKLRFPAVAFDLDGTLYPNYQLYVRLIPFLIREQRYLRAFGKARDRMRQEGSGSETGESFYRKQARYMGEILKLPPESLEEKTERLIYRGWEPHFKKVRLFPFVTETLRTLKEAGVKLGLLSDFPPGTKLEYLGLSGLWDAVLCSEEIGRLKPDPLPFRELVSAMTYPPEEILYVGNSFTYDVSGASQAGMKTAWITPAWQTRRKEKLRKRDMGQAGQELKGEADFIFHDYRQLRDYVLI
jgi:putative hydrolase of the HAD superfamily